jgi:gliding motility-associated-like protein
MKKVLICICFILLRNILFAQNISGIINDYAAVVSIPACDPCNNYCNQLNVSSTTGFNVGDKVLLIQMKGATVDLSNSASFGSINSYANAGGYEFKTISSISGSAIYFTTQISSVYNVANSLQIVRVPQYANPTVTGILTAKPWDGATGGVLVFDVSGTLTLQADIDVTATGFRGALTMNSNPGYHSLNYFYSGTDYNNGVPKGEGIAQMVGGYELGKGAFANAGGGGNAHNAGGGGGSNGGTGGNGGKEFTQPGDPSDPNTSGIGGYTLSNTTGNLLFMGGGGGAGHENDNLGTGGGNGGGIILINAAEIIGNNKNIIANGQSVATPPGNGNDGAGGGGSGGSIKINATVFTGNINLISAGGNGGNIPPSLLPNQLFGPGGGGGGGVICLANSVIPATVSTQVNGGIRGVNLGPNDPYSATSGNAGQVLTSCNFTPVQTTITHVAHPKATPVVASCTGGSASNNAQITFNYTNNTVRYHFNQGNSYTGSASYSTGSVSITNDITGLANPSGTDSYTIRFFLSAACSFDTTITISNTPSPAAPIVSAFTTCSSTGTQTLSATGSNLLWYTTATNGSSNATAPTLDLSVPVTTTYYVSQTVSGCESARASLPVNVKTTPVAPIVSAYTTCSTSGTYTLSATGTNLLWYTAATTGSGNSSSPTIDLSIPVTLSYFVSQTANGCESARSELSVEIKSTPTAPTVSAYTTCSASGTYTLTATGVNLLWYTSATNTNGSTTAPTIDLSVSTISTYFVSQTTTGCESTRASLPVEIKATPAAPAVSPFTICANPGTHTLTATGTNLVWYASVAATNGNSTAPTIDLSTPNNISYFVSQTINGCESARAELQISINIKPNPNIPTADSSICTPSILILTAKNLSPGSNAYKWYKNGQVVPTAISNTYIVNTAELPGGVYMFEETNGNCTGVSNSVAIKIIETPVAYAGDDFTIKQGNLAMLQASGGGNYSWSPAADLNNAFISNPEFIARQTIVYSVIVSDPTNTCSSTDEITVTVESPISIPNVITVNGDGVNDTWQIENIHMYPNASFEIFNRWGNIVWKSTGYNKEWDGTNFHNNEVLPDGTYFYVIVLNSELFNDPYTGYVQVIK